MSTLYHLQNYWWLLISVLGALLVFLLFVQGGQTMLLGARNGLQRTLIANSMGRKWELTFTTLVVFGGAFFASFPLYYSTSFGGAYWLWILILFSFVLQAISYEYRTKPGNIYGASTYDIFLFVNGCVGCILLGVAVSLFFFGADFSVQRSNILDAASPVISRWAPTHGFEAIFSWKNLVLGVAVLFLARTLASLYMLNNITDDHDMRKRLRQTLLVSAGIFLVFFLWFLAMLFTATGYTAVQNAVGNTVITETPYKYAVNYGDLWWALVCLCVGVVAVLYGVFRSIFTRVDWTGGIWFAGVGVVLVVLSLFFVAGYNDTAYFPSLADPQSSLSIRNSSSSEFTLRVMSYVSIIVPFVVAYIAYVWYSMDRRKLTPEEMESTTHKY